MARDPRPASPASSIGRLLRATGLVAIGAAIGSGALWAGGLATQAEIRACVSATDGHLYVAGRCPGESLVWSQQGPTGPAGPLGPPGQPGAQGSPGPPGSPAVVVKAAQTLVGAGIAIAQTTSFGKKVANVQAYSSLCPAGQHVVGGGYSIASGVPADLKVITNQEVKLGGKSGWSVNVLRTNGFKALKLGVRAVCIKTS